MDIESPAVQHLILTFFFSPKGQRKSSLAKVRVTKPGTGKFSVTHIDFPEVTNDITYFFSIKERHQVMYPLQVKLETNSWILQLMTRVNPTKLCFLILSVKPVFVKYIKMDIKWHSLITPIMKKYALMK